MKRIFNGITVLTIAVLVGFASCGNEGSNNGANNKGKEDAAASEEGVVLMIADADLIEVDGNPQYNTAEWLFRVDKPGRYDVWLSSLTLDTTQLRFAENVVITAGETKLAKKPVGDQIVTGDKSVKEPWFRADTHMGSIFFSKPGEYPVQVISDRVEAHGTDLSQISLEEHTIINSVILKPKVN
ncbi:MAG: hypothetical protein RBT50_05110 [Bacteroidales bacterium]|jgi:hypothetical protein|nr:hypothetical protein [Bacteroidales bacterium]